MATLKNYSKLHITPLIFLDIALQNEKAEKAIYH